MRKALVALLFTTFCSQACASDGRAAESLPLRYFQLQVQLICPGTEISPPQPFPCHVYLWALPEGGPVLVPRSLPPFRLRAWPDIKLQFEIREEGGAYSPLTVSPEADQGRWEGSLPLSEENLLVLRPGEIYGWSFDLNGRDWILPKKDARYFLRSRVTLRLKERTKDGRLEPAVARKLGNHPEFLDFFVPDGTWDSNEAALLVKTGERR